LVERFPFLDTIDLVGKEVHLEFVLLLHILIVLIVQRLNQQLAVPQRLPRRQTTLVKVLL
jgi:hypothetical protein